MKYGFDLYVLTASIAIKVNTQMLFFSQHRFPTDPDIQNANLAPRMVVFMWKIALSMNV